ncbi:MFS general substrate transporter [Meredithblackwellia eburnea MCA 4105]
MGRGLVDGSEIEKQTGVLKMETMARTWGRKGLLTIYAGVYLISTLMSLEYNTTPTIEPFLLSSLNAHSLLGAVAIVTNIAHAVGKPPMTKILDVYGRAEGCTLAAGLYFVGYMLTATAKSPWVFIVARAIATLGGQGIQLAQQIIVADTTTLTNRALITSTISLPWLVTTWLGPPLGAFFLSRGLVAYRIAYGIFGTLLPLVSGVLICTLLYEWKKAKKRLLRRRSMLFGNGRRADGAPGSSRSTPSRRIGHREESDNPDDVIVKEWERGAFSWSHRTKTIWRDLDVVGLASLTVGCILVLLPLTLAAKRPQSWADPETWILIFGGLISLGFFGYYEFNWSPMPLLPPRLLQNRTIVCGSFLGFFHFFSQFVYESFFTSFLQVAREYSPRDASYVSQSYIFSASIAAIAAGAGAKYTQRYRWIGISGVLIHMAGTWLMMRTRNLDSSTFELVLSQMIGGIGGGFTTIAAQLGCQSVVGHQDVGIATATFLTITQIGGAVGGAAAGAIWSTLLPAHLKANLPVESQEHIPQIMASLPYTLTFESGTPARIGINRAYVEVQQRLNAVAILMLLPALFCVCSMRNVHLEHEDQGQGEGVVVLGRASILGSALVS